MRRRLAWIAALLLMPVLSHFPEMLLRHGCNPMAAFSGLALGVQPAPVLYGQCFIDGNAGLTLQALGHLAAEDWLSGTLPWWDPYAGIGMPLAAEMQPAAFDVPFVLLLHFTVGLLLIKIATQILAGFCMLYCLRMLGLHRNAALMGALLYELNGTFAWFGDAPMLPLPFLPLLVAGIEQARLGAAAGKFAGLPCIALGVGYSILAGFPETAFIDGLLAAVFAVMPLLRRSPAAPLLYVTSVLASGLAGLALAAPALLPFLDSLRSGAATFRSGVQTDQLMNGQEAALLLPTLFGPPNSDLFPNAWSNAGGYVGTGTVLLGLFTLIGVKGCLHVRSLALGWTVFWLAVFLGEPVTHAVWQSIPMLNLAVVTRYAMPSISFLWTILAALAWEHWQTRTWRNTVVAWAFTLLTTVVITDCLLTHRIDAAMGWHLCVPVSALAWAGLLAACVTRMMGCFDQPKRRMAAATLVLADGLVSFMVPQLGATGSARIDTKPIRYLSAQPGFLRSYAIGNLLEPNYGSYFSVPTIQAFFIPAPRLWADFAPELDQRLMGEMFAPSTLTQQALRLAAKQSLFAAASVGYILVPLGKDPIAPLHDAHFSAVLESSTTRIYKLLDTKPYFDIVSGGPCTLRSSSRTDLVADCTRPATLVRRELFYPGWHTQLNGKKAPMLLASPPFQSVSLPAGKANLIFTYKPQHSSMIVVLVLLGLSAIFTTLIVNYSPAIKLMIRQKQRSKGARTA